MYPLPLPEMETESALQTSKPSIQSVYLSSYMQPLSIHPRLLKSAFLVKKNLCGEAQNASELRCINAVQSVNASVVKVGLFKVYLG